MNRFLIANTTAEQREAIVNEALGNISATCDGCSEGITEMYQEYIDGKLELSEVNSKFAARYVSGAEGPERSGCGM